MTYVFLIQFSTCSQYNSRFNNRYIYTVTIFLIGIIKLFVLNKIPENFQRTNLNFDLTCFVVQIQLDGVPIHLEGGNLPSTYVLEQIHFHWPAEHTMDGIQDALELHFVHYDNQYDNTSVASQYENGIAVVVTLFEVH